MSMRHVHQLPTAGNDLSHGHRCALEQGRNNGREPSHNASSQRKIPASKTPKTGKRIEKWILDSKGSTSSLLPYILYIAI